MKKLNQAWIFSDSINGHELQSVALANEICNSFYTFHCSLRQPWLSFSPRILPGFGRNIIWKNENKPNFKNLPDVIITTGRRMASIGKYFKRKYKIKHVQILNPTDKLDNYDVIICPEHDGLEANNLIQMQGSIHQFNQKRLNQLKEKWMSMFGLNKDNVLSIFIGNPGRAFFNSIESLSLKIIRHYPNYNVYISASRRTPDKYKKQLANHFNFAKLVWFSELDGDNPYLGMLSCSDILIVTADSINMVSEAVATNKPVVIVGIDCVSPKHKRFIKSLNNRVIHLGEKTADTYLPINSLSKVGVQVIDLLNDK